MAGKINYFSHQIIAIFFLINSLLSSCLGITKWQIHFLMQQTAWCVLLIAILYTLNWGNWTLHSLGRRFTPHPEATSVETYLSVTLIPPSLSRSHYNNVYRRTRPLMWLWAVDFCLPFCIPASISCYKHSRQYMDVCVFHVCVCAWLCVCVWSSQSHSQ